MESDFENKDLSQYATAVVMAGGKGSRLAPLTTNRPKPMVPIANRPMMEHIIDLLKSHGIRKVVATVHYLADEIQAHFGDGLDFDIDLAYAIENQPLGTAGSVKNAEEFFEGKSLVIISGDALTDCDLSAAYQYHREKKSLATLVLYRDPNPLEYGVVITDENGKVTRFLEKPRWGEVFSDAVNTGIYIIEPEVLDLIKPGEECDWSADVFPKMLAEDMPIYGYTMDGYWCDVGSLAQYREAQEATLSGRVDLPIFGMNELLPTSGIYIGKNSQIDETVVLKPPVMIGSNCRIKDGAVIGPYTVIGDNTLVEERALAERSVCWDNVYLGHSSALHSAIVCSRAIIKRDCVLREESVVGDRATIDAGSTIRTKIKIWPDKVVERGSTVTVSLIWGNRWRGNLFRDLGVAGLSNLEITPEIACRLASAFGTVFPARTRIVTSRDSTRSSRMIKRALISSLLSAGCDVLDLRSMAIPVSRHFIKASGAGGAITARKLPSNRRVTLIEMLDSQGTYISRSLERKIESNFYREDYRRADADDLGQIEFASRAVEGYQSDFFHLLENNPRPKRPLKVVVDYGYTALGAIYPAMLSRLGVDSMSLNAFDDAKKSPRTEQEIQSHLQQLATIVKSTEYDMGVLFTSDGERLSVVDSKGQTVFGHTLYAALSRLIIQANPAASFAMSVTAPERMENELSKAGATVLRSKADPRSLMEITISSGVDLAGDEYGGFIFPEMQNAFDAPYCFGKLVTLLARENAKLEDVVASLPRFHMAYQSVRVPWENKGTVMRILSEESRAYDKVEMVDGIKIFDKDSWALILPDSLEPIFHVYTESESDTASNNLAGEYAKRINTLSESEG